MLTQELRLASAPQQIALCSNCQSIFVRRIGCECRLHPLGSRRGPAYPRAHRHPCGLAPDPRLRSPVRTLAVPRKSFRIRALLRNGSRQVQAPLLASRSPADPAVLPQTCCLARKSSRALLRRVRCPGRWRKGLRHRPGLPIRRFRLPQLTRVNRIPCNANPLRRWQYPCGQPQPVLGLSVSANAGGMRR